MSADQLLAPVLTCLLGLLLPGVIRYMGKRIEAKLDGNNQIVMKALDAMHDRITALEDGQAKAVIDIAFLKGVQSERAQTAQAAVIAAALIPHPLSQENPSSGD